MRQAGWRPRCWRSPGTKPGRDGARPSQQRASRKGKDEAGNALNLAIEPAGSRRDAFAVSANRRGLLPALIEKDFWVCWTLERLFSLPDFAPHLLFKGGTSLSKVYGAIDRFSEDIDLSLSRAFVEEGLGEDGVLLDPMEAMSNTQRKQRTALLVAAFHQAVTDRLLPALRADIAKHLGEEGPGEAGWTLAQDARDPGTLHFAYPRAVGEALPYVRPEVKIELGGAATTGPPRRGPSRPTRPRTFRR